MGYTVTATVGYFKKGEGHGKKEKVPIEFFAVGEGKNEAKSSDAKNENDLSGILRAAWGARYLNLFVKPAQDPVFGDSTESITLFMSDGTRIVMTSSCKDNMNIIRKKVGDLSRLKIAFPDADACFEPVKA